MKHKVKWYWVDSTKRWVHAGRRCYLAACLQGLELKPCVPCPHTGFLGQTYYEPDSICDSSTECCYICKRKAFKVR